RYQPSILWNDISWPTGLGRELELMADYYNTVADGVVNDRWMPMTWRGRMLRFWSQRRKLDAFLKERMTKAPSKGVIRNCRRIATSAHRNTPRSTASPRRSGRRRAG